jgi:hypothetical protein
MNAPTAPLILKEVLKAETRSKNSPRWTAKTPVVPEPAQMLARSLSTSRNSSSA